MFLIYNYKFKENYHLSWCNNFVHNCLEKYAYDCKTRKNPRFICTIGIIKVDVTEIFLQRE